MLCLGSCAIVNVPGCTDPNANNYNSSATSDDGSCTYDVTFTVDIDCSGLTVEVCLQIGQVMAGLVVHMH